MPAYSPKESAAKMRRQVERTQKLCAALCEWLTAESLEQIEHLESLPPYSPIGPTPEDLVRLTDQRNSLQEAIDEAQAGIAQAETLPEGIVLATALKMQLRGLQDEAARLDQQISFIQQALEKS